MDRNMRSSYVNSGPRSLPHMSGTGSKRHAAGPRLSPPAQRLSPPAQPPPGHLNAHHNNAQTTQHDDLINYIYDSWNKVTRDLERGNDEAKYYQEVVPPRQLANFRPFNLEEWWAQKLMQNINRSKHRS